MALPVPDLTLVVPDLLRDAVVSLPSLERLLARSDLIAGGLVAPHLDALLFRLFGVDSSPSEDSLPIAAVSHALDSNDPAPAGWWIRADPVYLHLDRNRLVLFDHRVLKLSYDDAMRLTAEISNGIQPPPWLRSEPEGTIPPDFCVKAPYPTRWYLPLSGPASIQTSKLAMVHGQDIRHHLPKGEQAKVWRMWLNECQILLHHSSVNAEREARGDLPVNSLWFWGEGETPTVPPGIFSQVWSNDPVTLGLAHLSNTPHTAMPRSADHWLAKVEREGNHLVVLEDLRDLSNIETAEPSEISADRRDALNRLEREWFAPLQQALRTGTLASLTLYPDPALPRRITGQLLRRYWWRRNRSLATYIINA
ncbi:conserved hypothetical protein [Gammaproteobacteria bacterium]